jgi:putative nucleotidyltransferase with HDIG domain
LVGGLAFALVADATGVTAGDASFLLLIFGVFVLSLVINNAITFGYTAYIERSSFTQACRDELPPLVTSELAAALLTVGVAYLYDKVGLTAIALFAVVLFTFQYLLGQLMLSEQRAAALETRTHQLHGRTKQLAALQVGVLSALMHTLDLRDRMTARHCAAVARYSREIAAEAGCSKEEQDLVHTAGLLHDIGKFIFPDSILKGDAPLTEDDWRVIRMHPYQGAKIVADVDGYGPVGDIILAHHERIDGGGYPRGLGGDAIPKLSRMIAVADTYDVMTARDSYRKPMSSFEAIQELKRVAGEQLDAEYVDLFVDVLAGKDVRFRHGEDADFDAELGLEKRIDDYSALTGEDLAELAAMGDDTDEGDELDVAVGENTGRRSLVKRLTGGKGKTPVA